MTGINEVATASDKIVAIIGASTILIIYTVVMLWLTYKKYKEQIEINERLRIIEIILLKRKR